MENKTYETVDGVHLGLDDECWFAAICMDSFNYFPKCLTVREAVKGGQTAFWSNEKDCSLECDGENSL